MRLSIGMFAVAAAGVLGGAWLIAMWAFGLALVVLSAGLGVFAVLREDGEKPPASPQAFSGDTVEEILRRNA